MSSQGGMGTSTSGRPSAAAAKRIVIRRMGTFQNRSYPGSEKGERSISWMPSARESRSSASQP